jgi:gliding motility-associated-like protein
VPNNTLGFQNARTGVGYAGIAFWSDNEWRERIEVELIDSLAKDTIYCVKMFVVNKKPLIDPTNTLTSTSNLQLYLSEDTLIDYPNSFNFLTPSIKNPDNLIIEDTTNWTEISGCYKALGGEKYLTIGSFYNNAQSNISNPTSISAYYLIDDVSVEKNDGTNCNCPNNDTLIALPDDQQYTLPNIFTPNDDQSNDIWTTNFNDSTEFVIILNRWGNEIVRLDLEKSEWDGTWNGSKCNEGVYFFKSYIRGEIKNGFIHLVR